MILATEAYLIIGLISGVLCLIIAPEIFDGIPYDDSDTHD